jgi:UDP-N-acetyl-alpha-D-muramoyl-L-alanyl-L-glutamate epimerase
LLYSRFIFDSYRYDPDISTLLLRYRFSDGPVFEEKLVFDFEPKPLPPEHRAALDRIFRLIFLLAGVSYYKAFIPKILVCDAFPLDQVTADFLRKFYERGLAEFAYRNGISLRNHFEIISAPNAREPAIELDLPRRILVPVGGGKDSLVTIETLRCGGEQLVLFALGDAEPIASCIAAAKLPFIRVHRRLDRALLELNRAGALNGHVPITGILSAIALACAVMRGCNAVAMSNERSASAPNLRIDGTDVNHQYSKSLEFETDLSEYIAEAISPNIEYFSLLRPFSEIEIARRFSNYRKYFPIFRSCNTAFKQASDERAHHWCCDCPKCRFVFLALAPFVGKPDLVAIFGRNLLDEAGQSGGFAELCGLQKHKPFECVGETFESAAVMSSLAKHPAWCEDTVVRRLNQEYPVLAQIDPRQFRALLEARPPHRVPASYMAILDACG